MENNRKSHIRVVYECKQAMKEGKSFSKYGKKTRKEAFESILQENANKRGMNIEEYKQWLNSDI